MKILAIATATLLLAPSPQQIAHYRHSKGHLCHGKVNLGVAQRGLARDWVALRDSLIRAGTWPDWHARM